MSWLNKISSRGLSEGVTEVCSLYKGIIHTERIKEVIIFNEDIILNEENIFLGFLSFWGNYTFLISFMISSLYKMSSRRLLEGAPEVFYRLKDVFL